MKEHLFVYGTLMENVDSQITRFLKQNSLFVGKGSFQGKLFDLGHYPGAVFLPNAKNKVFGHIFELFNTQKTLKVLDEYEAVGEQFGQFNEYVRKLVPIDFNEKQISCWAYLYNLPTENLKEILSGNYLEMLQTNKKYQDFVKRV